MIPALRWAAMRAILMFQLEVMDKTRLSTNHNLFEEKREPKWIRTDVPLLQYQPNALPLGQTGSLRDVKLLLLCCLMSSDVG